MLLRLFKLITYLPIYPHWLPSIKSYQGNARLEKYFKGRILETGAGNCDFKNKILQKYNSRIVEFVATDFSSWDALFESETKRVNFLGSLTKALYGNSKNKSDIDVVCSATKLPFENGYFDVYCSFEVLEHIDDLNVFFSEARRVLKRGGYCVLSSPFLYRDHGGMEHDFYRVHLGGYNFLATNNKFKIIEIYNTSFFGTTLSELLNQYIIRKFLEGYITTKILLIVPMPFIFMCSNLLGYLIDLIDKDARFTNRHYIILQAI